VRRNLNLISRIRIGNVIGWTTACDDSYQEWDTQLHVSYVTETSLEIREINKTKTFAVSVVMNNT
jgi:hypothetical protein